MTIDTRPAAETDAPQMAALLNRIIAIGGTTAHQRPYDAARMIRDYVASPRRISCTLAVEDGEVLGFQSLEWADPARPLPEGWGEIATFVKVGAQGRGIGRALWAATRAAAVAARVRSIDATIRADNAAGLAYYGGLAFADYAVLRAVPLIDGTPVDRIRKRLDVR